ncbi:MAG: type III pantothenate kinase [Rhodocyclaceae bacterium]
MILLLDVGNTRLKWGLREGGQWLAQGAFAHDEAWTFDAVLPPPGRIDGVCGASVVSPELRQRVADALAAWGHAPQWLTPTRSCCGVRNSYVNPAQLGADRWAALIGAHAHGAAPSSGDGDRGHGDHHRCARRRARSPMGRSQVPTTSTVGALAGNTAQLPLADGGIVDLPTCTR